MDFFSSQLRRRLSLLHSNKEHSTPVSYRIFQQSSSPLSELTATLNTYKSGGSPALILNYSTLLVRKTILTTFQLFCLSQELNEDILYSYGEYKDICLAVHQFNFHHCEDKHTLPVRSYQTPQHLRQYSYNRRKPSGLGYRIVFADLIEVFVGSRVKHITAALYKDCSIQNVFQVAMFEKGFVQALTGFIATFTSLLSTTNDTNGGEIKVKAFVSNEILSVHSSLSPASNNLSWKDCLISGVQSTFLQSVWRDILCRLWSKVAEELLAQFYPLFEGGRTLNQLLPQLSQLGDHAVLEYFPAVGSCFKYLASVLLQEKYLAEWGDAFRLLLVNYLTAYRKGFKKSTFPLRDARAVLESQVFVALDQHYSQQMQLDMDKAGSILVHVEVMKQSSTLCALLRAMTSHITYTLLQSIGRHMCHWNFTILAWLVSSEAPLTLKTVKKSVAMMLYVASPRVSFPSYSSFHSLECRSRRVCVALHDVAMYLQNMTKNFYVHFQHKWTGRCSRLLDLHFPSPKSLKKNKERKQDQHSDYCELVIANIFLPLMEPAALLSGEQLRNHFCLLLNVFYCVLRKMIISNKALFIPSIGHQLLVDLHFLQQWLTSEDRGLNVGVRQLLSKLPIVADLEKGLSRISGEPTEEIDGSTQSVAEFKGSLLCEQLHLVFTEIAWYSEKDWIK